MSKIITIIIHTVKILHGTERESYTFFQRFWVDLIEIEKVHILNNFLTLFHTSVKCKRIIFRFTAQQYQTAIYFSKYNIIENNSNVNDLIMLLFLFVTL